MANIKKKNSSKKIKIPAAIRRNILARLFKKAIIPVIMICLAFIVYHGVKYAFKKSSFFIIETIDIKGRTALTDLHKSEAVRSCKGKNIFTLNIKELSKVINKAYPEFKKVAVKRVLPNTLEIAVQDRIPVALIKSYKYFPIDKDAVCLSSDMAIKEDLPVISGLSIWMRPESGKALEDERINAAFYIIKTVREMKILGKHKIARIDISNLKNILFYLDNGLEIRVGEEELNNKLMKMKAIFTDPKIDIDNLDYIDLRFKEAILGPK